MAALHIQPGELDRRITLKRKSTTQDAIYGTEVVTWVTHCTAWAQLLDQLPSKAESNTGALAVSTRPVRVRMRYADGITSDMVFTLADRGSLRTYRLTTQPAEIGGRRAWLEFMAEELTTTGAAP